jgi:hypothetical protein
LAKHNRIGKLIRKKALMKVRKPMNREIIPPDEAGINLKE